MTRYCLCGEVGEVLPPVDGKPRCHCRICTEVRCKACQELWGKFSGPIAPHQIPQRREAIMAQRRRGEQ